MAEFIKFNGTKEKIMVETFPHYYDKSLNLNEQGKIALQIQRAVDAGDESMLPPEDGTFRYIQAEKP